MSRAPIRGFSLVEMMVAMTIGLILIGGALSVLYSSKMTYSENERVARLQENGRAAIELMLRDMRAGGYKGCNQFTTNLVNTLTSPTSLMANFAAPVQGYESTGTNTWSPTVDTSIGSPRSGSDILAVRTSFSSSAGFVTNAAMGSQTANIAVDNPLAKTLPAGTIAVISDCFNAAVLSVSAFTTSGTTATIAHGTSDLGNAFRQGSRVVPIDTVVYYIRDSGTLRNGVRNPSLWRITTADGAQEMVEGIEAMQVLYGVDTNNNLVIDTYQDASAVTDWTRVISVSIALLIRSVEPTSPANESRTYRLLTTNVTTPNDRYERTLYTTTVALRNTTQ
jgi:type IV pilus assembly protein PilW